MNKKAKNVLLAATAFVAAMNMNGCVYGPPAEDMFTSPSDDTNLIEDVYGPPPAETVETDDANLNQCVYGPPEYFEEIQDASESEKEAVDNEISALVSSDDYKALDTDERREKVLELLRRLAEEGTEEYPYPLIDGDSVTDNGDTVTFSYISGATGEVALKGNLGLLCC